MAAVEFTVVEQVRGRQAIPRSRALDACSWVFAAGNEAFMIFINLRLPSWRIFKTRPKQFFSSSLTLDALAQRKTGPSFVRPCNQNEQHAG
jgi:hypothetical protein